ncbi:MAG: hypothetical protein ABW005_09280 [Burkholderiaceae bacterium]
MQKSTAALKQIPQVAEQEVGLKSGPVELSLELLDQVSGGLPKGGWETNEAVTVTVSKPGTDAGI